VKKNIIGILIFLEIKYIKKRTTTHRTKEENNYEIFSIDIII
jgi:hypothetical protein